MLISSLRLTIVWSFGEIHQRINKLQKYAARIILDAPYDSPSQPLFEKLDRLNIYERIEYSKGVLLYKSVHGLCPSYISELFTFQNSNVYSLRSASNSNMCLPRPNREIFKRTFQFSGVQIWNKLPTAVRSANTFLTSSVCLKNYRSGKVSSYNSELQIRHVKA